VRRHILLNRPRQFSSEGIHHAVANAWFDESLEEIEGFMAWTPVRGARPSSARRSAVTEGTMASNSYWDQRRSYPGSAGASLAEVTMDDDERRKQLKVFLRERRDAVRPEAVGLEAGPRRRTAGLPREEGCGDHLVGPFH
jgi:hypothetical protein